MTRRYIPMCDDNAYYWWHKGSDALARIIHEPKNSPIPTGLLDANGTKLFKIEEREPIGYIRFNKNVD